MQNEGGNDEKMKWDGKRGLHRVQQPRKTLAQNALCFQLTQRHALGHVRGQSAQQ